MFLLRNKKNSIFRMKKSALSVAMDQIEDLENSCCHMVKELKVAAFMYFGHMSSSSFSQKTSFDISCKLSQQHSFQVNH